MFSPLTPLLSVPARRVIKGRGESVFCQHDTRTASFVWRSIRLGVTYRPISAFNPFWRRDDDTCTRFGELACVRTACCPLAASHLGPTSRGRAQVTLSGDCVSLGTQKTNSPLAFCVAQMPTVEILPTSVKSDRAVVPRLVSNCWQSIVLRFHMTDVTPRVASPFLYVGL